MSDTEFDPLKGNLMRHLVTVALMLVVASL